MAELPVIVLAFANEQEGRRYLRDLPEELRRLQEILRDAERHGLCRLEVLSNATLDQIFDVFTRNRDQVTILHYGGHADSGRLLLESSAAGGAPAHASGLATFLGQRGGLQLVFLNGCSTRGQVARLLEAGVAAVIATARAIDDAMARAFAVAFYTELASGAPLRAAYEAARGRVLAAHDTVPEAYYGHRDLGSTSDSASPDPTDDHGFPWEFRPGDELVERWSLPDAAGNPEFGLPPLPERDLPERPFRNLSWFTAEHAEVFFGRGYQVRELYAQITDSSGPPILLLYGASGVGKSSLLDAGLVPRMKTGGDVVRYCRRDQQKGLSGSLRAALRLSGEQTTLDEGWRAEESRLGKALFVFLDQVEEVFTRPNPAEPHELDEFLGALAAALGDRDARPRGKLVLGFRKEWLAELDRRLAEAKLPRTKVFLKQLDRRGIIEAIRGPARSGRLQRQYRLAIEDGLPEVIADNLLADAGSALAPTLEVLLTKMWERARQANPDQLRFDRSLYESLKAEGYLLKDVLDEGLKAIGRWNVVVEESGLALDVLVYHTTDLGTASQHTRAELSARYAHQAETLEGLLGQCKDQYLIIEVERDPDSPTRSTRLAHDLLAPLVQQRFRLSIALGQRARRLLENRAPEWEKAKIGSVLDSTDLAAVEEGASGMRVWTADETRLVETSRLAEEQEKAREQEQLRRLREAEERQHHAEAEKQRETERSLKAERSLNEWLRKGAVLLGVALVVMFGVAWWAWREWGVALRATANAREKTEAAEKSAAKEVLEAEEARSQTQLAEDRRKTATSRQLAALSASERNKRLDRSLLLSVEAFRTENTLEARDSLFKALDDRPGLRAFLHIKEGSVFRVTFSPDGKTIAAGCVGGVVLWDVAARRRLTDGPLPVKEGYVTGVAFNPDGKAIAAGYSGVGAGGVVLWDVAARRRLTDAPLPVKEGRVTGVAFSPDGKTIAAGYAYPNSGGVVGGGGVVLWDVAARKRLADDPLPVKEDNVTGVAFSADGKTIAAAYSGVGAGGGGGVVLWDVAARRRHTDDPLPVKEGHVTGVAFSPDGKTIAAGFGYSVAGGVGGVVLWDVAARKRLADDPLPVKEGHVVAGVAFSPDGKTIAAGFGHGVAGGVVLWDVSARRRLADDPVPVKEGNVTGVAFSPDGKTIAAGYGVLGDRIVGGVVLWDVAARRRLADDPLPVKKGYVTGVAFSPDGKTIAAGFGHALAGGVVLWDVAARRRLADDPLPVKEGIVSGVAFSPDGKTIAAAYGVVGRGGVALWDMAARKRLADDRLRVKEGNVTGVAFSPDGKTIAAGYAYGDGADGGGGLVLCDVAARQRLTGDPLPVKEGKVTGVAFSPDGKTIAAGYAYGAYGSVVGVGGVVLWDVAARKRLADDPLPVKEDNVTGVAFSPDGKSIAAGYGGGFGGGGGVVLWDVAARKRLTDDPLPVKEEKVTGVAFSPDGKSIAAGYGFGGEGGVVLWDVAARKRLADDPLPVKEGIVAGVAFSPDGKSIAAGYAHGVGGGVVLWDVDLCSWQNLAGRIANRNFSRDEWRQYFPDEPYHRTFRKLPWPSGMPEKERKQAEQKETELPACEEVSTR